MHNDNDDVMQVCSYFAEKLLASRPRWPFEDFLEEWKAAVPEVKSTQNWGLIF